MKKVKLVKFTRPLKPEKKKAGDVLHCAPCRHITTHTLAKASFFHPPDRLMGVSGCCGEHVAIKWIALCDECKTKVQALGSEATFSQLYDLAKLAPPMPISSGVVPPLH